MSTCLLCHNYFEEAHSWSTLFSVRAPDPICITCTSKFEMIHGDICAICGRPFAQLAEVYRDGNLCYDCIRWEQDQRWQGVLTMNRSVFLYNEFAKEVISLYKFRSDYIVSDVFTTNIKKTFQKHYTSNYLIIPIPLSNERLYERGFNQATVLAQKLGQPIHEVLSRFHHEKQSKKGRADRLESENVFQVVDSAVVKGKDILLIDDIYTTGSTLRQAGETLLHAGANIISSLTLMRS
ncbi:ComF family protein [Fredinandcohnia humi]